MSDPLRHDILRDRTAHIRIEELLVAGLDHYFSGEFDEAIHIWTRVLFLDRGHARARAYIERARSALAERQRESEELVHRGLAAFAEGDAESARSLLTGAVKRGASDAEALAVLGRLDRLHPHDQESSTSVPLRGLRRRGASPAVRDRDGDGSREATWAIVIAIVLLALLAGAGLVLSGALAVPDFRFEAAGGTTGGGIGRADDPVPVPTAGEVAIGRAQAMFSRGRLRDALRSLDAIRAGDPHELEAQALRANIQRALLATAGTSGLPVTVQ
jgi:tetratricopeptide (TPR) repeat protein